LGDLASAGKRYAEAKKADPDLAAQYAYLGNESSAAGRAGDRSYRPMLWADE
jgi:hypothetical protein